MTKRERLKQIAKRLISSYSLLKYSIKGRNTKYLLVDTPTHGNLGDQAIAEAEKVFLEKYFGKDSYYEVTANEISGLEHQFAAVSPKEQVILVHGGGFLGKIWPLEEYRFRRILKEFRQHRIIVFPQTITFGMESRADREFFQESKRLYTQLSNLTITCRDHRSYKFLAKCMPSVDKVLVPDIVLSIDITPYHVSRSYILYCMRSDKEQSLEKQEHEYIRGTIQRKYSGISVKETDTVLSQCISPRCRKHKIEEKLQEFSGASLVVTDRLHGMLFAAITGTPCIAFDNGNGKVGDAYKWVADLPYILFVKDIVSFGKCLDALDINCEYQYMEPATIKDRFEILKEILSICYSSER